MIFIRKHWPIISIIALILFYFREFFFTGKLIYGQDIIGLNYPLEYFITDAFKKGEWPLWNPYSASGYPFLPGSSVFYPLNIIFRFLSLDAAFSLSYVIHFLIGSLSMYALARYHQVSKCGSFISAVAFILSGFFVSRIFAGHYMLIQALAWFPLFFLFLDKLLEKFSVRDILIAAFTASLVMLQGHPQPFIYLVLFAGIYTIAKLVLMRSFTKVKVISLVGVFVVSAALCSVFLLPTVEGVLNSSRGEKISWEAASEHSLHPKFLLNFLLPDFYGNPATSNYHGGSIYNEVAVYIGIIPLLLALLAMIQFRNKKILLWTLIVLIALFLALGKYNPVYRLLYEVVPGFSNARIPARLTWVAILGLALLAGLGFDVLKKRVKLVANHKIQAILVGLVILDLLFYASKSLVYVTGKEFYPQDQLTQYLQNDNEVFFRNYFVGSNIFHDRGNVLKISEVQSDASLIAGVYGELLEKFGVRDPILDQAKERAIVRINHARLLDLLNVKYLIPEGGFPDTEKTKRVAEEVMVWYRDFDKRLPTRIEQKTPIYIRNGYLPRVYLVDQAKLYSTSDEFNTDLTSETKNVNFADITLFDSPQPGLDEKIKTLENREESAGIATIQEFKNNEIEVNVKAVRSSLLNLSEVYYPGWRVFVNGKEEPLYRSNYAFRSVFVPAGESRVRFVFDPWSFRLGATISIASLLLVSLFFLKNRFRTV